ncbi:MAG: glycine cleavage system protein R [Gammaproteobacteria bacterium]|nr:glycine cleavage system protein R [Gammaproteobacteria bacterium]
MNKHIVITAVGKDRPGIVNDVSKVILNLGGNISDSHMSVLGGEFALHALVSGAEQAIASIEKELTTMQNQYGLSILIKHTEPKQAIASSLLLIKVVSLDQPGIVHEISDYLADRSINIEEMETSSYAAAHTGTQMFQLDIQARAPDALDIDQFCDRFVEFCNEISLDASITRG